MLRLKRGLRPWPHAVPIVEPTFTALACLHVATKYAAKTAMPNARAIAYDSVCDVGPDTLETDTLKEGLVFESIARPPLRSSISPSPVVGALLIALLKTVTTIRFPGCAVLNRGTKPDSVPFFRVSVARPLSAAVSS
jgi:hypothetical protein